MCKGQSGRLNRKGNGTFTATPDAQPEPASAGIKFEGTLSCSPVSGTNRRLWADAADLDDARAANVLAAFFRRQGYRRLYDPRPVG